MKLIAGIACCLLGLAAQAQYSVADYPTAEFGRAFAQLGSRVYFIGQESATGRELWRLTNKQPERVTDIWQGPTWSVTGNFKQMAAANGSVYFPALDRNNGGTILYAYSDAGFLTEVPLAQAGVVEVSKNNDVVAIGNSICFVGIDNNSKEDIYSYTPGTGKIVQLTAQQLLMGAITEMMNYNGLLVFSYSTSDLGKELGVLDPKTGILNTYDISTGTSSSLPGSFTVSNNALYFAANTDAEGRELYSYNPLTGPVRLTDIQPGTAHSVAGSVIVPYRGSLVFSAYTNATESVVYQYDLATKTGSQLGSYHRQGAVLTSAAEYGGKLFMNIDTSFVFNAEQLYIYDGAGLPKTASQLLSGAKYRQVTGMKVCGNKLYFTGAPVPTGFGHLVVVTDSTVLGVNEQAATAGVDVYPNPVTTEAHISLSLKNAASLHMQLTDMQGRVVYSTTKQYNAGKHEIVVPVSELAVGMYMYTLTDAEGAVLGRGKLVKE